MGITIDGQEVQLNMRWVKCSDKFPDNSDNVLCLFRYELYGHKKNNILICYYRNGWENEHEETWGTCTHWMPLPKPPED